MALAEFAVIAIHQAIQHFFQHEPSSDRESVLASLQNNLAIRLADLGRPDEALAASEQAVMLFRALAEADPDAFLPEAAFAGALTNHSNRLADVGSPRGSIG